MRFQDKSRLAIVLICSVLAFGTIVHAALSLEDTWQRPDVDIEGFCDQPENTECGPYRAMSCDNLPNNKYRTFRSAAACAQHPSACVATNSVKKALNFHGEDVYPGGMWEGFPMISRETFSKDQYISAEIRARAYCSPQAEGCFFSLNLYNGESNYRGIAYVADPGMSPMRIDSYGTCPAQPILPSIPQGSFHTLRIDYYGHEGGKWVYFVDDIVRKIEDVSNVGSVLQAHPRVALFFAGKEDGDYVEGETGPLRVWTGNNEDARQTSRVDGFAATPIRWFAQEVFMKSTVQNITKVRLFLVTGQRYAIAAYTDTSGKPGTLINETFYTADRNGFKDVPLWVPQRYISIWIRIAAYKVPVVDFGTSAPGTNPYPGKLLLSDNEGRSWTPMDRDMYFITYERR